MLTAHLNVIRPFYQLFAIMDAISQVYNRSTRATGVSFVYALVENQTLKHFVTVGVLQPRTNLNIWQSQEIGRSYELSGWTVRSSVDTPT